MKDQGCGLADTAMEPSESASLQAAMEFPSFGRMGPLLRQLHSWPKGVDDDKIQLLKDTIVGLCISLVDVLVAKDAGFAAKWWIKEVRELCYDTEDYLGEFMKQKQSRAGARRSARLSTMFRVGSKLEWRPQAQIGERAQGRSSASRLREICTKRRNRKPQPRKIVTSFLEIMARAEVLDDVSERFDLARAAIRPDYAQAGVSRLTPRLHHQLPVLPTPISVHMDAGGSRLVDVEEPVNKLADLLAFDDDSQKQLKVVCILGFPGVGKTTVATTLYHNFGGKFQCRAFVRVTRSPDMIKILTSILKQTKAPQVCSFPDAQDLIDNIREHLQGKRYFIVIDDLSIISSWNIISRAFPDDNCCSRIVTTTGNEDISLACCAYHLTNIFEMRPLSFVKSSELFFRIVIGSEDGCSQKFGEVLHGIVRKCGGSPLAIICAASLLASVLDLGFEKWEYIQDSLSSIVSTYSTSEGMKEVLNLIYNDLHPDMKTCLLHLGIYPEGYTIRKDDLVKQWVAEGFLNTIGGQDMENIAGAYFDELVSIGIVQNADTNYNGEVLFCTVHQMVLDFIRDKSIEENFAITVDCFQTALPLADKVRRLSVQFGGAKSAKIPGDIIVSHARSLLFCGFFKCVPSITDYGILRVLILHIWADEDKTFDLTSIHELFHLTYLNIESNITIILPAKIRGLQYLVTLEVDARLSAVPSDIVHLKKLLHLRLPSESNLPHGVGRLASLRTLGYFDIGGSSVDNVLDLGKLTNLQDLQLTCSTLQPVENLEKNMQLMGSVLEKLSILQSVTLIHTAHSNVTASSMSISCDNLSRVSHAPALLERIELLPRIFIFPRLPKWIEQLGRLRILKIAVRELREEGIDILKALPGLTALTLYVQTAPSERIVFDKEGFFVLKYFNCRWFSVPRLKFEAGAMPNLLKLKLSFNAARVVEQQDTPAISIERLSSLEEISTKIGGAGGDAESALTATITNDASNPRIIVRLVDWFSCGDAGRLTNERQHMIQDRNQVKEKERTHDSRAQHRAETMDESVVMWWDLSWAEIPDVDTETDTNPFDDFMSESASVSSSAPSESVSVSSSAQTPNSFPPRTMAAAETLPPTTSGMGFLGLLSFRRASFDPAQDDELLVLDAFQAHVANRLAALFSPAPTGPVLSLAFLSKLLDAVVSSDAAFRDALAVDPAALARAPADRLVADLLHRVVKSLDVLNAVSLALASIRGSHRAASCLLLRVAQPLHHAQFARARRAIAKLFPNAAGQALSFSVYSKNWPTGRQVHAMAAHLAPSQELAPSAECGLGLAIYTMSSLLVFAMWALVAAVPCQDRDHAVAPVAPPKQAQWAAPMMILQERIVEESRQREKKDSSSRSSSGLLAEMQAVERAARELRSLLDEIAEEDELASAESETTMASVSETRAGDVVERAEALAGACRVLEDGLTPLERQVRAVFHHVVRSRSEVVWCIKHGARSGAVEEIERLEKARWPTGSSA